MTGTTQANVDDVFDKFVEHLQTNSENDFKAYKGEAQRKWDQPEGWESKDLTNIADLHKDGYERDELNTQYEKIMQSSDKPGTLGDLISVKQQIEFLAVEERAMRTRYCSPCRALAHMHGRRLGHSASSGVFAAMKTQVEDYIKAGGVETAKRTDASVA